MYLKLLRFLHIATATAIFKRLMDTLGDIFFMQRYKFENILSWTLASVKLILSIHIFTCGWIKIATNKAYNGAEDNIEFHGSDHWSQYAESFYFMTTTITTVGYGDLKAFYTTDGSWGVEMGYLMLVTFAGILLFALVVNEIFNYKHLLTVSELVSQKTEDMSEFMN